MKPDPTLMLSEMESINSSKAFGMQNENLKCYIVESSTWKAISLVEPS